MAARASAFADKVVLITGGTSGIGLALGRELAAQRAVVVLAGRRAETAAAEADAIRGGGGRAEGARLDVADASLFSRLVEDVARRHGRLDLLFNNAGVAIAGEARRYALDDWNHVLGVNLHGVVHGIQAAYPLMISQGHGQIVNVASLAGLVPALGPAYAGSKHAVVGLSLALRAEAARYGVEVSVVCPGFVDTPILLESMEHPDRARFTSRSDLPRMFGVRAMPVERAAREILRGVARRRAIIVVTPHAKVFWRLYRLFPAFVAKVAGGGLRPRRSEPWGMA